MPGGLQWEHTPKQAFPVAFQNKWAFVVLYRLLMKDDAPQAVSSLRLVLSGLRSMVRTGCPWRMLSNDLPPRDAGVGHSARHLRAKIRAWRSIE